MPIWRGNTYRFTVTSANATAGATYTNNGQTFTVTATIAAGTVLFCTGTGAPTAAGTLTRTSGTGDAAIVFSANVAPNVNWGTATNWDTGALPVAAAAGTDAIFDSASLDCTVNVAGVCRNLNFTGYTRTITINNNITVGSTSSANQNHAVTLSPTMGIGGTAGFLTRANGVTTLTSNGRQWPNGVGLNSVIVATNSTIALVGNWTNLGNVGIGPGSSITMTGAFNFTCLANLTINVGAASSSALLCNPVALSTIILAGNSTYVSGAANIGVNLTINSPGNTVTLADGASYGGTGTTTSSAFTYIAGTVVCTGTFHLNFQQGGTSYTVNVNGDPSTSATTTNASGVNFNNLALKTAASNNPSNCTFTSPVCVVNDLSVVSTVGTKVFVLLSGNTIHANKSFIVNGVFAAGSTTTIRLQGTGNWSENQTLTVGVTGFGVTSPVVINTTGTITLTSFVGIRAGSLTYTAGNFVTTNYGLRVLGSSLNGLGSGGVVIESMYHTTSETILNLGSAITINDTSPLIVGYLTLDGFTTNRAHKYLGTAGWTCNDFYYQQISSAGGCDIGLTAESTIEYKINNSLIARAWNSIVPRSNISKITGSATRAKFTLMPGASQDVFYMGGTNVDSSAGQTVWSRKGLLTNTINWSLWTYPKTRFSTFTS